MLALRLPEDVEERLAALAKATGRSKSYDAREAIVQDPEDLVDIYLAEQRLIDHRKGSGGQVVSLESTTYPGTTEEELAPRIGSGGLKVGEDIFLVYSPEREDPANPDFKTQTIPKVCGGYSPACQEVGQALYGQVVDRVVPVSSARAAEMTKLLENIHRAVNIGLVNEMKMVADRMGIDIYEVIDAAATKPFGFVPYYPGPGPGGHCIPIDPFYLTWKAREYGLNTRSSSSPVRSTAACRNGCCVNSPTRSMHAARLSTAAAS